MKLTKSTIAYSKEFFKKKFSANSMKEAYLNACKWYATNVLSKDELQNVQVKFEKGFDEQQFPTVTIRLFAVQDGEEDVMAQHCRCCKEMHHSFFINEDTHCSRCSALGFQNRLEQKINIKKDYYKEKISKRVKEDE